MITAGGLLLDFVRLMGMNAFLIVGLAGAGAGAYLIWKRFHPGKDIPLGRKARGNVRPATSVAPAASAPSESQGVLISAEAREEGMQDLARRVADELVRRTGSRPGATLDDALNAMVMSRFTRGDLEGEIQITKDDKGKFVSKISEDKTLKLVFRSASNGNGNGKAHTEPAQAVPALAAPQANKSQQFFTPASEDNKTESI